MHLQSVRLLSDTFPTNQHYPFNLPIMRQSDTIEFSTPVTFFVGENGTGKSTLLEAISHKCGIHIWQSVTRTRVEVNQFEDKLHRHIAVKWSNGVVPGSFYGSDTFRHFTRSVEEWAAADPGMLAYFGGESLVTKSHGQSMMAYFASRYRIPGLYLLDEPETALSPKSQLSLVRILSEMGKAGHAQFIVATHSPILLACPESRILSFDSIPIAPLPYRQTEYYKVYKAFMEDPEGHFTSL